MVTSDVHPIITAKLGCSERCCVLQSNQKLQLSCGFAALFLQRGRGGSDMVCSWLYVCSLHSRGPEVSRASPACPGFGLLAGENHIRVILIALVHAV